MLIPLAIRTEPRDTRSRLARLLVGGGGGELIITCMAKHLSGSMSLHHKYMHIDGSS